MDVDSVECVGAIAMEISQFLERVARGGAGKGVGLYKKDETKSKNGELFTRGIFSNFELSSPLFNAASCFCLRCRRRRVFSWMKEKRSLASKVLCFCLR